MPSTTPQPPTSTSPWLTVAIVLSSIALAGSAAGASAVCSNTCTQDTTLEAHPGFASQRPLTQLAETDANQPSSFAELLDPSAVDATSGPSASQPSEAALVLADRFDVTPTATQLEQLRALDDLDAPLSTAVTDVIEAFLAYDAAARTHLPSTPADARTDAPSAGVAPVQDAGLDLLAAAETLEAAVAASSSSTLQQSPDVSMAPALMIDFDPEEDQTYTQDAALIVDVGGNERYLNNAGGNGLATEGLSPCDDPGQPGAAALIDLLDADTYGDVDDPRSCGVNGGGYFGAGFLADLGDDGDRYVTGDTPCQSVFVHGSCGANGGGVAGVGLLFDRGGDDVYDADDAGANGGGYLGGLGTLLDAGGDDEYQAGVFGVNGGGYVGGAGVLVDADGSDSYVARGLGANGAGLAGVGLLVDADGQDEYRTTRDGDHHEDESEIVAGTSGMRLDSDDAST